MNRFRLRRCQKKTERFFTRLHAIFGRSSIAGFGGVRAVTGHKTESVYQRYAIVSERDVAESVAGNFRSRSVHPCFVGLLRECGFSPPLSLPGGQGDLVDISGQDDGALEGEPPPLFERPLAHSPRQGVSFVVGGISVDLIDTLLESNDQVEPLAEAFR